MNDPFTIGLTVVPMNGENRPLITEGPVEIEKHPQLKFKTSARFSIVLEEAMDIILIQESVCYEKTVFFLKEGSNPPFRPTLRGFMDNVVSPTSLFHTLDMGT